MIDTLLSINDSKTSHEDFIILLLKKVFIYKKILKIR